MTVPACAPAPRCSRSTRPPPAWRRCGSRLAVTSTHMIVTEPVPDLLEEIGWTGRRVRSRPHAAICTTSAPPTTGGSPSAGAAGARLRGAARRQGRGRSAGGRAPPRRTSLRFFPGLRGRRVDAAWGGPVDVSPTHLPGVGTLAGGRVHYVCGFTGNGVGPAHLAGATLASLALGHVDSLTRSALVEPRQPPVPREPARFSAAPLVRAALVRQEDARGPRAASGRVDEDRDSDPRASRDPRRALTPRDHPDRIETTFRHNRPRWGATVSRYSRRRRRCSSASSATAAPRLASSSCSRAPGSAAPASTGRSPR